VGVASAGSNQTPTVSTTTAVYFTPSTGSIYAGGNVTAYSDERLKKDWADVSSDFVEQLAGLLAGTYTRTDTGIRQAGVGAQSLQKFFAEVVSEGEGGILSVAYGQAAMVACVKLAQRVLDLEARLKDTP
jgi:hypothetical protein